MEKPFVILQFTSERKLQKGFDQLIPNSKVNNLMIKQNSQKRKLNHSIGAQKHDVLQSKTQCPLFSQANDTVDNAATAFPGTSQAIGVSLDHPILFPQNQNCCEVKQSSVKQIPQVKQSFNFKRQIRILKPISREQKVTDESSEDQYDAKSYPGPGEYNIELPKKSSFRSKKSAINKIFYSQSKRFQSLQKEPSESAGKQNQPTESTVCQNAKGFFISKLPKFHGFRRESTPPPGYYNTRQTLEYDLIRSILKSSNSTSFINSVPRALDLKASKNPGPGSYNCHTEQQELSSTNYIFKSSLPRKLQYNKQENQFYSCMPPRSSIGLDTEVSMIHVKEDPILESEEFGQSPPFLSSSQRFPHVPLNVARHFQDRQLSSPKKSSPNKVPFNSSSKRQLSLESGSGVGVGLYDAFKKNSNN